MVTYAVELSEAQAHDLAHARSIDGATAYYVAMSVARELGMDREAREAFAEAQEKEAVNDAE